VEETWGHDVSLATICRGGDDPHGVGA